MTFEMCIRDSWGVISLAMVIVFNLFSQPQHSSQPSVTYSEFLRQAAKGEVSEVVIQGNTLTGKTTDGKSFQIYVPNDCLLYTSRCV